MNKKEFNISVSVKDNNAKVINGVIQYDTANLFNIYIMDGSDPFDFTGYGNVIIEVTKPDGTRFIDANGGTLDILNEKAGLVGFNLPPQCVLLTGTHFASISIYSNGVKVTTARFNYIVSDSMDVTDDGAITSQNDFSVLQTLLAQYSVIAEYEKLRAVAENLRSEAENARTSETQGIITTCNSILDTAKGYADTVKNWYDLFMSAASSISGVDLSTVATKADLTNALAAINCGEFTGTDKKKFQILRGLAANLPTLAVGEMGYETDTNGLYIGTSNGNKRINDPCFIISASAPSDTTKLWIDTANNSVIKYYNGTSWIGTNTAVFA